MPAIGLYALLTLYPLVRAIPLSLTNSTGGPTANNVGLANYRKLLHSGDIRSAVIHTLVFTLVVVVAQTALGLAIAASLRRWGTYGKTLAVLLLTPALLSPVMASFIWSALYNSDGPLNATLDALGLSSLKQVWLGDPSTALYAIAVVNIWMFAGFSAAIFAAGFRNIPVELTEAARIDGASRWQTFRSIEWPLLAPALTVTVTLSLTGTLRVLELPLVMTKGGPVNSTNTLGLAIYNNLFQNGAIGYGTAISVLLLVVVVVIATSVNTLLRRREGRI
ncbi:carbohydrate ABC transporter permease [Streptomyces sp. CBMA29]|uniref:carbohydrate ABC transporter permease n=1 Tax=Streptomyces sp. CBMA29 TaxID=1896314 RepID=UPI001CB6D0DC|nr:sugar ABC transporter permease [Streptomyces sp. CBMA29]